MSEGRTIQDRIDEMVIGLADDEEHAVLEDLAGQDPEVAQLLDLTRARFTELDLTADSIALPGNMWARVEAALEIPDEQETSKWSESASSRVVSLRQRQKKHAMVWATISSLAASVVLAITLGWTLMSQPDPIVTAVLLNSNGKPVALIEGTADNTTYVTLLGATSMPDGRIMQVWTKPEKSGPPISLGIISEPRSVRLKVTGLPMPHPEQLYEITFEQPGGSPTNLPTGPIHGVGLAQQSL